MGYPTVTTDNAWLQAPDERLARYNAWDVRHTAALVAPLQRELLLRHQDVFWREHFWPMVPVVIAMQRRGVGELDRDLRNRARRWVRAEVASTEEAVWEFVKGTDYKRETFFDSPKQLGRFLYDELGLKARPLTLTEQRAGRKGRPTDQKSLNWTLNNLRRKDQHAVRVLHDLFHRSRLSTILERYLTVEGDADGRVRPTIKLYGARTGRLAYAGLPGEALQQWPDECRRLVRAALGHVFISRDFSQIEARILAYLSGDRISIDVFEAGGDIHTQNALDLFGQLEVTKAIRNYAKTFLYGISYGGEAESLNVKLFCPCPRCTAKAPPQVNLSRAQVIESAARWKLRHQAVFDYRDNLLESVKGPNGNHTYVSPFGCHRVFMEPREACKRSLWDYPMQHCAAMIINRAMVRLHAQGAPITLQNHDQLILEVPAEQADEWDARLQTEMERPVPELGGVIFPTTPSRGQSWGELE